MTKGSSDQVKGFIVNLAMSVALPAYMISNLTQDFSKSKFAALIPEGWMLIVSMRILFIISWIFLYLFNMPITHRGTFRSMFFNSNTIFCSQWSCCFDI